MATERITPAEYARRANVNRSTVSRWIANGRITVGPDGKLDVERAERERDATESPEPRHQARKQQIDADKAARAAGGPDLGNALHGMAIGEKVGLALRQAQLKRLTAQAEQANLDLDKAAGQLVERAEIDYVLTDLGRVIADRLHNLPDRYTPDLAACQAEPVRIHKALEDIGAQVLAEIHEHLTRKAEEHLA
jgi:phage terminase Nu1 subunit (DNA packaging protein)